MQRQQQSRHPGAPSGGAVRELRDLGELRGEALALDLRRGVPGRFKLRNARSTFGVRDPLDTPERRRVRRILSSIHRDVQEGSEVRVRRILRSPRELFRLELARPEMSYERTTIVDADVLETLLEETPEPVLRDQFVFRS